MNSPIGHCGEKVHRSFVFHCSYHSLGDLSTTLEMTVLGRVFLQGRTTFPGDSSGYSSPLNDRTTLEMTVSFFGRHFDQVKRVEKSPKAKQDFVACYHTRRYKSFAGFSIYAKAFDMCCRTRYALKGVMVGKVYISLFFHCSYHSLGDLSTTLEMTVLGRVFLQGRTTFPGDSSGYSSPLNDRTTLEMTVSFFGRHFDQVKRVEKSPKAKQDFVACYHTRRYKSFAGFSIYAKAFDMCCRTRYALKGVVVRKCNTLSFYTIITACRVYHQSLMTVYHQR